MNLCSAFQFNDYGNLYNRILDTILINIPDNRFFFYFIGLAYFKIDLQNPVAIDFIWIDS